MTAPRDRVGPARGVAPAAGQAQAAPQPALMATGGVISLRVDTYPGGEHVGVLRAQVGALVGIDCPVTGENIDVLIDALKQIRPQVSAGSSLVVAGADALPGLNRAERRANGRH